MYSDKKQYSGQYRGNTNRKSWPRMNPKHQRRTGSSAFLDRDGDTDMNAGGSSYRGNRGKQKNRYNPGYATGRINKNKTNPSGWWKIIVHDADKFDKDDFFKMLDNTTNESIDPQNTRFERNKLVFWIKGLRAKEAIYHQSGKLTLKDHTISMFTVPSDGPEVQLTKDEQKTKICNALVKRYADNKLDLSDFHRDPDMVGMRSKLFDIASTLGELVKEKCADLVCEIDFANNNLKHTGCLRDILSACKDLKKVKLDNNRMNSLADIKSVEKNAPGITHLSLINNPLKNLMDDAQYIADLRKMFPKLIELDGLPLPERISFETEEQNTLPPTQKYAILLDDAPKNAINNFFLQYVRIHDSGSEARKQLAPAYDETCLFSISVSWSHNKDFKDKFPRNMPGELFKRNRSFQHCIKAEQRESRLFIGQENVVKELCQLGDTKHMLQTLNIDTLGLVNNHVTAILSGMIDSPDSYRTFSRTFVLAANSANGSFLILNDQLSVVRSVPDIVEKVESQFPVCQSEEDRKANLVKQIQGVTKMKDNYCVQCLDAARWEPQKALEIFNEMRAKIPADAFLI